MYWMTLTRIAHRTKKATAQRIKNSGEIDEAISQIGGVIVVDAEYALDLLRVSKKYRNSPFAKSKK